MKKVLIVGGGIAGLTSAILLERNGYEVEIAEQAEKWEPVGAGIVLWPNALKVLELCGIREEVESRGNILQKLRVVKANGKLINGFNFKDISKKENLYAIGIFRPELHTALVSGLKNTKVILGASVETLNNKSDHVEVQLTNGKRGVYDFVIGADGIHSKVRKLVFGEVKLRYSGYANWRFMIDNFLNEDTAYEMWGNGLRFGFVPVGGNKLYCFSTINSIRNNETLRNISVSDYKKLYSELGWKAGEIINSLTDNVKLIYDDLLDLKLKSWYRGNVVLIGDAAHAITPNLGSGAAMAMEDAMVLIEKLNKNTRSAFVEYYALRNKRVNYIRDASYWLGKGGQLKNILGFLRNSFVSITGKLTTPYTIKKVIGIK